MKQDGVDSTARFEGSLNNRTAMIYDSDDPEGAAESPAAALQPSEFEIGFLIGILVGEGHFGGDGKQPQVTLRMHTDHQVLFRWIITTFPGGRLYGPYNHSGRRYFQWMARGSFLTESLVPILDRYLTPKLDGKAWGRYQEMKERYRISSDVEPG